MWMLWKLLQSGLACSTGVKKVDVIVLDLVGIVCMTQAGQAAGVLGLYGTGKPGLRELSNGRAVPQPPAHCQGIPERPGEQAAAGAA